jgi:transcriptional regulator GlxA family with amidase domain
MRPGAETVISRLTDILFVHVLRQWLTQQHVQPHWLAAFNDQRIAPAMSLIHSNPEQAWTVVQLAAKVGLSRSRFTVRFSRVVGESPRAYITRVRMLRAAHMLKEGSMPVAAVALAAGYESESSFNKAFKRFHRIPPGQFHRAGAMGFPDPQSVNATASAYGVIMWRAVPHSACASPRRSTGESA